LVQVVRDDSVVDGGGVDVRLLHQDNLLLVSVILLAAAAEAAEEAAEHASEAEAEALGDFAEDAEDEPDDEGGEEEAGEDDEDDGPGGEVLDFVQLLLLFLPLRGRATKSLVLVSTAVGGPSILLDGWTVEVAGPSILLLDLALLHGVVFVGETSLPCQPPDTKSFLVITSSPATNTSLSVSTTSTRLSIPTSSVFFRSDLTKLPSLAKSDKPRSGEMPADDDNVQPANSM